MEKGGKLSRWAMRQPLVKTPDSSRIPKRDENKRKQVSKYVHVGRARPMSAHPSSRPRSRSNTLDSQYSSTLSASSHSSTQSAKRRLKRPSTAPAFRGRRKETPFEKQLKLATKQANLMRMIRVESERNKDLTIKINNTKKSIQKIRTKLKGKAKKKLLNLRNASAQLEKKAMKEVAIKEDEVAALRRRRSQLNIVTEKEKEKVNDLRIYSMTLEATFGKVKKEYLYYEQLRKNLLSKAKDTNFDIHQCKKDEENFLEKHEKDLRNVDGEIDYLIKFTEMKNAENQVAQEAEMEKVVTSALEESSHNPKALKHPGHGLFSNTMKGIGKLFGRRMSSASLSSSFGQPGTSGLPRRKKYPPVEPQKVYNAFLKASRSKMTLFSHSDIDELRNAKDWESVRLSPSFVEVFIRHITAFDDKIVGLIESIQVLKESIEVESKKRKKAFTMLRESKIEHEAQLSGAKQKTEALQNMSKALKSQLKKKEEQRRQSEEDVNSLSDLILKVLKDLAQSKHLQAKAKLEQEKKKPGRKLQKTPEQAEEHAIWDAIEVRKANNEPPVLKETIRGMEILESHVYDLLDIVAGTRPDLLKNPETVYHGSFKKLLARDKSGESKSHLSINIDSDVRRTSYFGPPSPYQQNRSASMHKTRHDVTSSPQHFSHNDGEALSHLGVLSTAQLRKQMRMGKTL